MSVEDRVRAATRARADLVRDIRPLDLPAAKVVRPSRVPRPRWSTSGWPPSPPPRWSWRSPSSRWRSARYGTGRRFPR